VRVVPIPGASAATVLVSAAGLQEGRFLFEGFLPSRPKHRRDRLTVLARLPFAFMLFEAPHRIEETAADLATVLEGRRELVLGRELTKQFEQIVRMEIGNLPQWLAEDPNRRRGEFVLLVFPEAGKRQRRRIRRAGPCVSGGGGARDGRAFGNDAAPAGCPHRIAHQRRCRRRPLQASGERSRLSASRRRGQGRGLVDRAGQQERPQPGSRADFHDGAGGDFADSERPLPEHEEATVRFDFDRHLQPFELPTQVGGCSLALVRTLKAPSCR
jgi:hypothetical protein